MANSSPPALVLIVGGNREDRLRAALAEEQAGGFRPAARLDLDPGSLPWVRPAQDFLPVAGPRLVRVDDLDAAFPDAARSSTRLILTQSAYLLQQWIDSLGPADRMIVSADRPRLMARVPEAFARRGPWRLARIVEADAAPATARTSVGDATGPTDRALREMPAPPAAALLFQAGECRVLQDTSGARTALDEALRLAPDWEAVHFEDGKFWLALDEMERARAAFQRAADLMPTFSDALSNLGATLGELDRPEAALAALSQAVELDPDSVTAWNNVGVVNRELGRLDESEGALSRVIGLAPGFVFGHYNLGHTRFLRGDYRGAVLAYEKGQGLDPAKTPRQGCRLAMARFATSDVAGAEHDLWRFADAASAAEREDLLLEAYETAHALVQADPALSAHRAFLDRIARALTL